MILDNITFSKYIVLRSIFMSLDDFNEVAINRHEALNSLKELEINSSIFWTVYMITTVFVALISNSPKITSLVPLTVFTIVTIAGMFTTYSFLVRQLKKVENADMLLDKLALSVFK
jgi:hypothetical protein